MKEKHLEFLACPSCKGPLKVFKIDNKIKDSIESGMLCCSVCKLQYKIIKHIPRFVQLENYASNFGFEWNKHSKTQIDSETCSNLSEKRFFEASKWSRNLKDQLILEVGCGAGRFTEQAALTGGMVVSMDYSNAVDANYNINGNKNNVLIVQGDIYNMPFRNNFFDKLFCFGVLQHTPNVKKSFMNLPNYLKKNGMLAIDVYRKRSFFIQIIQTKYWVRPLFKRINLEILYKITCIYVNIIWPLTKLIHKLPYGRKINGLLLIADFRGAYNMTEERLKDWAILDTFDMLSPAYDQPQSLKTIKKWFNEAPLKNIEVNYGHNGIEGRGTKK